MGGGLKRGLKAAADMILPRRCVVCGRRLNTCESHLCLHCMADIPFTYFWKQKHNVMADRFNAVIQSGLEDLWGMGEQRSEGYAYAIALFLYDRDADYRHIPHQIKYHGNMRMGRHFGRMLGRRIKEAPWMGDVDVVVPVPLHWRRKWSRGYNQAEVLAEEVAAELNVPVCTGILRRVRHTGTQTKLDFEGKAVNVAGAFAASSTDTGGMKHILIVDDVFTSGSTLHACLLALRNVFPTDIRISIATLCFAGG